MPVVFGIICGKGQPLCLEPHPGIPVETDAAAQLGAYVCIHVCYQHDAPDMLQFHLADKASAYTTFIGQANAAWLCQH